MREPDVESFTTENCLYTGRGIGAYLLVTVKAGVIIQILTVGKSSLRMLQSSGTDYRQLTADLQERIEYVDMNYRRACMQRLENKIEDKTRGVHQERVQ